MPPLHPVRRVDLEVTSGPILEREPTELRVAAPIIRATVPGSQSSIAGIQFQYRGEVPDPQPSGSGLFLHQIGLMLRWRDPCNLVYVMWRIKPAAELVVFVKKGQLNPNRPGCQTQKYHRLDEFPVAPFQENEAHELLAELRDLDHGDAELHLWHDGQQVGPVVIRAELLGGVGSRPGLRTDNGLYDFRYLIGE